MLITGGPQDRRTLLGRDCQVELREARLAALLHIRQVPDEGRNQGALSEESVVLSEQSGVLIEQSGVLSEESGVLIEQTGVLSEQSGVLSAVHEEGEQPWSPG